MKKNLTEVVMILDRSGSMHDLVNDTIGGFNSVIAKQKNEDGDALVTTVLFDNKYEILHDRVKIENVKDITDKEYFVRGSTALIDAIGKTVDHIAEIHKYIREEDVPEHTIFVIITDGYENASSKYSSSEVKKMISEKQEKDGWEFVFLGANIDAVETAKSFGIREDMAVDYIADAEGTEANYESVAKAISGVRMFGRAKADWADAARADYKKRKK